MDTEENDTLYADALLGRDPNWNMIDELEKRGLGRWTGGFHDRWDWNPGAVRALPVDEQKALYERIKEAWGR
jgi:hypothetical protein